MSGIYKSVPPGGLRGGAVNPEVLDAYEVGLKTEWFNHALSLNFAGCYGDNCDLRVTVFAPTTVPSAPATIPTLTTRASAGRRAPVARRPDMISGQRGHSMADKHFAAHAPVPRPLPIEIGP